jgi:hypothetical protein
MKPPILENVSSFLLSIEIPIFIAIFALGGCEVNYPSGIFSCSKTGECPPGLQCCKASDKCVTRDRLDACEDKVEDGVEPSDQASGAYAEGCGDGRVTGTEKCDTAIAPDKPGSCPVECPSEGKCLLGEPEGSGCNVRCVRVDPGCTSGDGCCPSACNNTNDSDCSSTCGDGIVQVDAGETCEPASAFLGNALPEAGVICPVTCKDDGKACTSEVRTGKPENCNVTCTHVEITSIVKGDGCCPKGANANTDRDCKPICGNGIREANEECDSVPGCDTQCKSSLTEEQRNCVINYNYANATKACHTCLCTNCMNQSVLCFGSDDETKKAGCTKIISCGYSNQCVGRICYCGTAISSPDSMCLIGANGPCKETLEEVAGTTSMLAITMQESDPNTAVGRANALAECFQSQCLEVCF